MADFYSAAVRASDRFRGPLCLRDSHRGQAIYFVGRDYKPVIAGSHTDAETKQIAMTNHGISVVEVKRGRTPGSWKRVTALGFHVEGLRNAANFAALAVVQMVGNTGGMAFTAVVGAPAGSRFGRNMKNAATSMTTAKRARKSSDPGAAARPPTPMRQIG